MKKSELQSIRARIAELAAASHALTVEQSNQKLSGEERHAACVRQRRMAPTTRALMLAYAFLRGVPYRVAEPASQEPPWMTYIGAIVMCVEQGVAFDTSSYGNIYKGMSMPELMETRRRVEAWLSVPETQERIAARELARLAWIDQVRVRRQADERSRREGLLNRMNIKTATGCAEAARQLRARDEMKDA